MCTHARSHTHTHTLKIFEGLKELPSQCGLVELKVNKLGKRDCWNWHHILLPTLSWELLLIKKKKSCKSKSWENYGLQREKLNRISGSLGYKYQSTGTKRKKRSEHSIGITKNRYSKLQWFINCPAFTKNRFEWVQSLLGLMRSSFSNCLPKAKVPVGGKYCWKPQFILIIYHIQCLVANQK